MDITELESGKKLFQKREIRGGKLEIPSPIFVTKVTNIGDGISLWMSVPLRKSGFLFSYSKKTPTSKVGDELRLLPT